MSVAISNLRDRWAVSRATRLQRRQERQQDRKDKTVYVASQPTTLHSKLQTSWLLTKICVPICAAGWFYTHLPSLPSLSWVSSIASMVRTATGWGSSAASVGGGALGVVGNASKTVGQAIVDGTKSAAKSSADYAQNKMASIETEIHTFRCPDGTPYKGDWCINNTPQAKNIPKVDVGPSASIAPSSPAATPPAPAPKVRLPEPSTTPQVKSSVLDAMNGNLRREYHFRGKAVRSNRPGFDMVPCGADGSGKWALVRRSDRWNTEPGCELRESRLAADELPVATGNSDSFLSTDPGYLWRQRKIGKGWRWVAERLDGDVASVDGDAR